MSQALSPVFACDTCQRLLAPKVCKSNKNGNAGRLFTACYKKHENGTSCSYFKWADDRLSPPTSRFASSSPLCSPTSSARPSTQPATTLTPTPQLAPPPTLTGTSGPTLCAKSGRNGSKSMRLHPDCKRRMCRRHCLEAGGCQAKGHNASAVPSSAFDMGKQRATSLDFPPSRSTSPVQQASTSTDFFADPRHASQMTAVFTEHYARQQALEEQQRAADAERIANIEKVKSHVIIYAWQKVCYSFFYSLLLPIFTCSNRTMLMPLYSKFKVDLSGRILLLVQLSFPKQDSTITMSKRSTSGSITQPFTPGQLFGLATSSHFGMEITYF